MTLKKLFKDRPKMDATRTKRIVEFRKRLMAAVEFIKKRDGVKGKHDRRPKSKHA